jgi:hypothetical protein
LGRIKLEPFEVLNLILTHRPHLSVFPCSIPVARPTIASAMRRWCRSPGPPSTVCQTVSQAPRAAPPPPYSSSSARQVSPHLLPHFPLCFSVQSHHMPLPSSSSMTPLTLLQRARGLLLAAPAPFVRAAGNQSRFLHRKLNRSAAAYLSSVRRLLGCFCSN